jgi:hypothetical protein
MRLQAPVVVAPNEECIQLAADVRHGLQVRLGAGDDDKARQAALAAVSLKNRSEILKALAMAAKTLGESGAAPGVKKQRQAAGEHIAKTSSRFATPSAPKLIVDNRH